MAGKKYTYVRSDKLKNHRRSYRLRVDDRERSLFKTQERNGKRYRVLNKKTLKERFQLKVRDQLVGIENDGNLIKRINDGWGEFIDEINASLHGSAQQEGVPGDQVQWRAGWDAQLFRYYAGAQARWELLPTEGKLNIGANAVGR